MRKAEREMMENLEKEQAARDGILDLYTPAPDGSPGKNIYGAKRGVSVRNFDRDAL